MVRADGDTSRPVVAANVDAREEPLDRLTGLIDDPRIGPIECYNQSVTVLAAAAETAVPEVEPEQVAVRVYSRIGWAPARVVRCREVPGPMVDPAPITDRASREAGELRDFQGAETLLEETHRQLVFRGSVSSHYEHMFASGPDGIMRATPACSP